MNQRIKKHLNNSGFTLVEMLVAAGVLSIIVLGFSGYMFYQSKTNNNQTAQQNMNYLQTTVLKASAQPDALIRSENLKK